MLGFQWKHFANFNLAIKDNLEIIVVDDGSKSHPAKLVNRPEGLPAFSIFRILHDIRWNQDAARNIGAHEARAPWLLLTDIDHLVPEQTLSDLYVMRKNEKSFYSFPRIKYGGQGPTVPHRNSYFMAKTLYWKIGGHDEDFAGIYGKDILFRKRANRLAEERFLSDSPLIRLGTETIRDAGTHTISRRNSLARRVWGYLLEFLKKLGLWRGVQTLKCEYTKVH